jgi:hypothetical protein
MVVLGMEKTRSMKQRPRPTSNPWLRLAGRVLLQALADYLYAVARGWIVVENGKARIDWPTIRLRPSARFDIKKPFSIKKECELLIQFWYGHCAEQWFDYMNIHISLDTIRENPRSLMRNYKRIVRVLDE